MGSVVVRLLAKITVEVREVAVIQKPDIMFAVTGKNISLSW